MSLAGNNSIKELNNEKKKIIFSKVEIIEENLAA